MSRVVVERAGLVESAHRVHVAVVDSEGRLTAGVGEPERIVFHRSTAKPFQAVPVAVLHVLDRLGVLDGIESEALDAFRRPNVTNTLGEEVGVIRADFQLEKPA